MSYLSGKPLGRSILPNCYFPRNFLVFLPILTAKTTALAQAVITLEGGEEGHGVPDNTTAIAHANVPITPIISVAIVLGAVSGGC